MEFSMWELFVAATFLLHAVFVPSLLGVCLAERVAAASAEACTKAASMSPNTPL
jgi:hypothetical protein